MGWIPLQLRVCGSTRSTPKDLEGRQANRWRLRVTYFSQTYQDGSRHIRRENRHKTQMKKPLLQITGIAINDGYVIQLHQVSKTRYLVSYGQQVKTNLTWQEAATELGNCIFHQLECNGKIQRPDVSEAERRNHNPR